MNLIENIKEGLRSVQANMLRSVLTALIVAIGITSLVGIFTAIDGIESTVAESFASLGVNTFDIKSKNNRRSNNRGITEKIYPPLQLNEALSFVKQYNVPTVISLSAQVSFAAEIKRLSKKTNPNVAVFGVNSDYMAIKGLDFKEGRNFSMMELENSSNVVILGSEIVGALYGKNESPINTKVSILGTQFKVIGTITEKGQLSDDNFDNTVYIPIKKGNQLAGGRQLFYVMSIGVTNFEQFDYAMGEATGLMRIIRHDRIGKENSFDINKSETLAESTAEITGYLRVGGFGVGFITLLGASIALMNIMLVSVTERTREVGVRKALGATPLRIRQQFVIEAIVVCLIGGIVGVVLGILVGNGIASLIGIEKFIVPWAWMFMGMVVCVFVGLLSGYYPAHKASKLDPIESLRFE
jgi:putative ABC transport system permease protein